MGEFITRAQLKKIWARSREIGLDEELLRILAEEICGERSLRALSKVQAARLIDRLERRQPHERKPATGVTALPEGVSALPAPGHIARIRELQQELGWDEDHLNAWLKKYFRVGSVRRLDWRRGRGAFLALLEIKRRKQKAVSRPAGG